MELDAVLAGVPGPGDPAGLAVEHGCLHREPEYVGPTRLQRGELLAGGGALDRDHGATRGDILDRAGAVGVTAGRVVESGEQRRGVGRVRHDEELVVADPPHDDVVDDMRIVGVEQVGVLRPSRFDAGQVVRERPLEQPVGTRTCDAHRSEVRDVERDRVLAAGAMLLEHARELDRHLPAAERRHARAERAVFGVERTVTQRGVCFSHGPAAYAADLALRPTRPPGPRAPEPNGWRRRYPHRSATVRLHRAAR